MSKLRAILVDDEEKLREFLKNLILTYIEDIEIIGEASNPKDGEKIINELKPDIVFLDVEMPGGTGFSLLKGIEHQPNIVFVTAYEQYAIKAIKAGAVDYILKPVDLDELQECVEKIRSNINNSKLESPLKAPSQTAFDEITFKVVSRDSVLFVKQKDITHVIADGAYSHIHTIDGKKHTVSKNLKEVESQLDSYVFMRCHSSHLINLYHVVKLNKGDHSFVELYNKVKVDVSRRFKNDFIVRLNEVLSSQ